MKSSLNQDCKKVKKQPAKIKGSLSGSVVYRIKPTGKILKFLLILSQLSLKFYKLK
jgi:hypothetical protein